MRSSACCLNEACTKAACNRHCLRWSVDHVDVEMRMRGCRLNVAGTTIVTVYAHRSTMLTWRWGCVDAVWMWHAQQQPAIVTVYADWSTMLTWRCGCPLNVARTTTACNRHCLRWSVDHVDVEMWMPFERGTHNNNLQSSLFNADRSTMLTWRCGIRLNVACTTTACNSHCLRWWVDHVDVECGCLLNVACRTIACNRHCLRWWVVLVMRNSCNSQCYSHFEWWAK